MRYIYNNIIFLCVLTDVRKNGNRIDYLVAQKDGLPNQIFAAGEMIARWPGLLFEFLEKRIEISGLETTNTNPVQNVEPIGNPIRVTCELILQLPIHSIFQFTILIHFRSY